MPLHRSKIPAHPARKEPSRSPDAHSTSSKRFGCHAARPEASASTAVELATDRVVAPGRGRLVARRAWLDEAASHQGAQPGRHKRDPRPCGQPERHGAIRRRAGCWQRYASNCHLPLTCGRLQTEPCQGQAALPGRNRAGSNGRRRPRIPGPGHYTHSPARITGTAAPAASRPSTSTSPEPIIQSMWIRLVLAPRRASSSSGAVVPPSRQVR